MTNDPNFFYAAQGLHFYKVFVRPEGLAGACVAGNQYDENSVKVHHMTDLIHFGLLAMLIRQLFLKPQTNKVLKKRAEIEAKYDAVIPGSLEFLAMHTSNFIWLPGEVASAVVNPVPTGVKKWFQSMPTLDLVLDNGRKEEYELPLDQNPEFVVHVLRPFLPSVRLQGTPGPGGAFN